MERTHTAACHYISINDGGGGDHARVRCTCWESVQFKCVHLYRCLNPTSLARVVFFSFSFLLVSLHLLQNSSVSTQIPCWVFFSTAKQRRRPVRPSTAPRHRVSKTVTGCPRDVYNNSFFFFHPSRSTGVWREQKQTIAPGTTTTTTTTTAVAAAVTEAKDVYVLIKFLGGHEEKKLNHGLGQKNVKFKSHGHHSFWETIKIFFVSRTIKKKVPKYKPPKRYYGRRTKKICLCCKWYLLLCIYYFTSCS